MLCPTKPNIMAEKANKIKYLSTDFVGSGHMLLGRWDRRFGRFAEIARFDDRHFGRI